MQKKLALSGLLASVVLSLITFIFLTRDNVIKAQTDVDVILDYETRKSTVSKERTEKNQRFDSSSPYREPIKELVKGLEVAPTTSHWWIGLSAIPTDRAEAVMLGSVTKREAFLSNDEKSIYTEYEIRVEKVLKNSRQVFEPNEIVPVVRRGGAVRFKSGKVQRYTIDKLGVLKDTTRYLLFLERTNGVDWFVLTGYQLTDGKVTPLDGSSTDDPKGALPFLKYRDTDEQKLLQDVRRAALQGGVE